MTTEPKNGTGTKGKVNIPWAWILGAAVTVILTVGILAVQWQSSASNIISIEKELADIEQLHAEDKAALNKAHSTDFDTLLGQINIEIDKIIKSHDEDIARLDESNRTRRNQIADLEERIAILEERTRP